MKNLIKYSSSFFMILIILVSTLQFSLYKMECLMSGNTQISLSDFEDCTESKKDDNSISQKCCDFHEVTFDFNYDTKINLKDINSYNPTTILLKISADLFNSSPIKTDLNFYTNLPPPSGYELLKVVQVFRL